MREQYSRVECEAAGRAWVEKMEEQNSKHQKNQNTKNQTTVSLWLHSISCE